MFSGKQLILNTLLVLRKHYPDFNDLLNCIPDHRTRHTYQVAEILIAGLSMFIFKRGSRNNADNGMMGNYEENHLTIFGMKLPIMDTVNNFLKQLPPEELEKLKHVLVQKLLEKKVLEKWKYKGRHWVAVDATGVFSSKKEPFTGCPYKTSKNGKKTWTLYVLEAKIICSNGFSISIASEILSNSEDLTQKQDCEQKAFIRLAERIKRMYPRLPITILADGLYPYCNFFKTCSDNNWNYIVTFKDKSLKKLWRKIHDEKQLPNNKNFKSKSKYSKRGKQLVSTSDFINKLSHKTHDVNWVEYHEYQEDETKDKRFVFLTNITITQENVWDIVDNGRLRWKIENEGFNTQKNTGYNLQHKYSRKNLWAINNYYNLLQIAHMINQLTEKLLRVKELIKTAGQTITSLTQSLISSMTKDIFTNTELLTFIATYKQLRY